MFWFVLLCVVGAVCVGVVVVESWRAVLRRSASFCVASCAIFVCWCVVFGVCILLLMLLWFGLICGAVF